MVLEPLGEAAYLVRELPGPAYALAEALNAEPPPGLIEAVASYETIGLFVDPDLFSPANLKAPIGSPPGKYRTVEIPTSYLGEDLDEVAAQTGLSREQVIERHSAVEYRCFAIGFCPGFPFLGYLDDSLVLPRRQQPRERVPPGSVAIAARQTGVYPSATPGGWWLIGHTDMELVDLSRGYFALRAGDLVRFVPVEM